MKRKIFLLLLAVLLAAVNVIQAALRSCSKCGYEQAEDATKCSHCGAALAPLTIITNEPVATPVTTRAPWASAAEEEFNLAKAAAPQNRIWLAWFYARNAAALNTLAGETRPVREADLMKALGQLEVVLRSTQVKCPACDGTGRRETKIKMSDGRIQTINSNSQLCLRCGGSGLLPAMRMPDILNHQRAQVARDYDALQQDHNWTPVTGVWLPPELAANLTLSNRVAVLRALGSACLNCAGMGIMACAKCEGAGYIKCSSGDCLMGTTTCPDCGGSGSPKKTNQGARGGTTMISIYCTTCQATGRVVCKICRGKASLSCNTCMGKTALVCKACSGTGQNPECVKCRGGGLMDCIRCKGSGKYRDDTCPACQGQGNVLCTTCQGIGKVSRR
ncbi:MAG: hypothetical protein NTV49_12720 [Kiritimatiellaeota bacterium]|nr:hypothetical protein [Kiritimatiellota bacterium]